MKNVLVTGGLGFIGSHICVELLQLREPDTQRHCYKVFIIDNLENSKYETLHKIHEISGDDGESRVNVEVFDLLNADKLRAFFEENSIDTIIHCAGKKAVGESVREPLLYYSANLNITLNLLAMVRQHNVSNFIFSSSATVYGNSKENDGSRLNEMSVVGCNISNPYGKTKYMQEEILQDFYNVHPHLNCYLLRYFNPVGCHPSGLIGENPNGIPNNLMPYIIRVAANNASTNLFQEECYKNLTIFGTDYSTADGTCIRDYIHVCDLARAHIDVLSCRKERSVNVFVFNVGTGRGISVLDMVKSFEQHNAGVKLPHVTGTRRGGDEEVTVCDNTKITCDTSWRPKYDLMEMVRHSWNYIKTNYDLVVTTKETN